MLKFLKSLIAPTVEENRLSTVHESKLPTFERNELPTFDRNKLPKNSYFQMFAYKYETEHNAAIREFNNFVQDVEGRFAKHDVKTTFIQELEERFYRYKQKMISEQKDFLMTLFPNKASHHQLYLDYGRDVCALDADAARYPENKLVIELRIKCIQLHLIAIDEFIANHGEFDDTLYFLAGANS